MQPSLSFLVASLERKPPLHRSALPLLVWCPIIPDSFAPNSGWAATARGLWWDRDHGDEGNASSAIAWQMTRRRYASRRGGEAPGRRPEVFRSLLGGVLEDESRESKRETGHLIECW